MTIRKAIKEALIPACVTLLIFLGVLALKGIFPFGALRIDYYDMGQTNAPLYYHIWDFLHGRGGLFYTWYIDEGQNLSMGSSIQWNISVFNLFFLLIRRSAVLRSLSLFMGLRLFFMAFNMNLFLQRRVDTPKLFRVLFGIAYGLTGFTLTHYTIPTYLDTAALMPLYLLTLGEVLFSDGKAGTKPVLIHSLMTGYMTALGYYMAFMNLIFILLVSGTAVVLLCGQECDDKKERNLAKGRAATRLGISTLAGIGLSGVFLLPAALQMAGSARFNSNLSGGLWDTLHEILWAIGADMYYIKWWLLSGSLAAIVITLSGLLHFRKEKRVTVFFFLLCMYPCAMIPFESINLLWHMGTYYHYPIRCGYLIPVVLLTSGAYYAGRFERERKTSVNRAAMAVISGASAAAAAALIVFYVRHDIWPVEKLFKAWALFALVLLLLYTLIFSILKRPAYLVPVLLAELAVTGYAGYGQPHFQDKFSSDPEQSGEYVAVSQLLKDELGIGESRTDRIKNPDTTLNTNYGFVLRRATVGGWANTVPRPQMETGMSLGYGAHFMRILDSGGTLLSDAALHVTETLSVKPELYEKEAYTEVGEAGGYTLFKNRYTLPFVMRISSGALEEYRNGTGLSGLSVPEATNTLYRLLCSGCGIKDDGVILNDITESIQGGRYRAEGGKALYLQGGTFESLTVNGRVIPVPDIADPESTAYPGWFNSNLLYLGIYTDEDIAVSGQDPACRFFELDCRKLSELCGKYADEEQEVTAGKAKVRIVTEGGEDAAALIPMAYDKGFTAKVNGKKVPVTNLDDMFMALPLSEGRNEIRLSFVPQGLLPGILISLISLAGILIFARRPVSLARIYPAGRIALTVLFLIFGIVLYLIPYIAFVVHQIEKRL